MPKLAHDIVIDHEKGVISIDGDQFPWFIPLTGVDVQISPEGVHTITLPIYFDGSFRVWGKPAAQ